MNRQATDLRTFLVVSWKSLFTRTAWWRTQSGANPSTPEFPDKRENTGNLVDLAPDAVIHSPTSTQDRAERDTERCSFMRHWARR